MVPWGFGETRVEAESLPHFFSLGPAETSLALPVTCWKLAQPICSREPRDEDTPGRKEVGTREIMA